eukprot:Seg3133.6 transcript_id=Seg3133.6/GoldUCD/mRNA.D3Y31 product="hypothetical protein" protein_id=Seg3133.6/GoldUCD/D3Y31
MESIAVRELINRRNEIETATKSRQDRISTMLAERTNLIVLSNAVQQWACTAETIERFSQGNPTLKSYREACSGIKSGIDEMKETVQELEKANIPQFDSVSDSIDRMDVIVDEDQPTGTNVEDLRAILGETCGTLDIIIGLMYS